jgi:hypothetical protein
MPRPYDWEIWYTNISKGDSSFWSAMAEKRVQKFSLD